MTSGGKNRRSTAPGTFFEPGETLFEEAFAPLGHNLATEIQPRGDLIVAQPAGSEEDHLGSNHISIR
jgi:hypothetical protein